MKKSYSKPKKSKKIISSKLSFIEILETPAALALILFILISIMFIIQIINKPVWIVSHRCNDCYTDLPRALDGGCNGVEVDIKYDSTRPFPLILEHDTPTTDSIQLNNFLKMNEIKDSRLTLIIFDIKDSFCIPQLNKEVHTLMDQYNIPKDLYFIYSVPYQEDIVNLQNIDLRSNEGVCVDGWSSASGVAESLKSYNLDKCWYGYGKSDCDIYREEIHQACKDAVYYRDNRIDENKYFKKVETWTVYHDSCLYERLNKWQLDSIMVDGDLIDRVDELMQSKECGHVRLATKKDNPFD